MLTVDHLIGFKFRMEEEIKRLSSEMKTSGTEREAVAPDKAIGKLSRLDSMQRRNSSWRTSHRPEVARDRIDTGDYGTLSHKLPYFHAQLPRRRGPFPPQRHVREIDGNLLVASSAGIQIFDPRDRMLIVLPRPRLEDARTNYVASGGPDRKTLYVATTKTIYKRAAEKFQGVDPATPAKPKGS